MQDEHHNPDSIERLFQKKAGEYQIPFRKEDWNRLEKRLELYELQRSYRRKFLLAVAAIILIVSSVGYFTYDHNVRLNQLTDQIQGNQPIEISPVEPPERQVSDQNETLSLQPDDELNRSDQPLEPNQNRLDLLTKLENSSETLQKLNMEFDHDQSRASDFMANLQHIPVSPSGFQFQVPVEFIEFRILIPKSLFERPDYFTYTDYRPSSNPDHESIHDELSDEQRSKISLGVTYSPDYSRPDFSTAQTGTGYRFGMKGEYQIADQLFLNTGVLLSRVHYSATGQQYNPSGYYWNQSILPDETNAICLILEIPIGLKYNVFNLDQSRFFSTASLSSYIMLNEEYRFNYSSSYPGLQEQIKIKNGSRHFLNHLNLSIGYEYDLTPAMSVRTEPFINLPMSGVGWGDVRFYSMGGFISLNFQM